MVTMELEYLGGLRCSAIHGPSGNQVVTDAPVDNHGKGESFSPSDLVATATGACIVTIMGIIAERERIDLKGVKIHVTKEMAAEPLRRIGHLGIQLEMPFGLSDVQRKKLEAAALTCPVKASLHPDVTVDVHFLYPDQR